MRKNKKIYPKPKNVTLGLQLLNVEKSFPSFEFCRNEDEFYWIGKLTPSSNTYTVKIIYRHKKAPKVFIVKPEILKSSPHCYPDGSLCLYYPLDKDYNSKFSIIADTIIPWTSEWLYYYEKWLDSGVWWGPEAPYKQNSIERIYKMEEFS
ncbi:hypothetical protein [Clostridium sp. C8-1-8]|uniref:hypothetical protein n=1 Tax=Clostridium sp. C8-1-8 TaxID=2698831 RepID=UPI0013719D1E|nr:hypothetical protein [Clostridium sp. C8-1-8]